MEPCPEPGVAAGIGIGVDSGVGVGVGVGVDSGDGGPAAGRVGAATAVVTGAADGIGRATVDLLARAGVRVLAVDVDEARLASLADEYPGVRAARVDVRSPDEVGAVAAAVDEFSAGRLDLLANVAGSYARGGLATASAAGLGRLFAVNVVGPTLLAAALLPALERAGGSIVNVSSTLGHRASAGAGGYAASKAAVEALTRSWALELAPRGVRVNAVAPGPVETAILIRAGLSVDAVAEQRRRERAAVPAGRLGTAADVAHWIAALGLGASWVTGQIMFVDGGMSWV